MEHPLLIDVVLMLVGGAGFSLAFYIYHCKHKKKPLICPMRSSCEFVTTSDYSKIFGIPVEVLGMCYYTLIVLLHGAVTADPALFTVGVAQLSLVISTFAFLFSLYLLSVQAFVLRQWCTWCLCSAFLCAAIFGLTVIAAPGGLF
jgi:uncharacterized membrane protein